MLVNKVILYLQNIKNAFRTGIDLHLNSQNLKAFLICKQSLTFLQVELRVTPNFYIA